MVRNGAEFSACRKYRYALWRVWSEGEPLVMFIGLNPSVANETEDDPTIRRCIRFARQWGYGGVCMANLFALVATDPASLFVVADPVGPENDRRLFQLAAETAVVIAAWGNHGTFLGRSHQVRALLPGLRCLKINLTGEPAHPLYLRADCRPVPLRKCMRQLNA